MRCPNCKNKVLQKSGSQTRVRIEGAVTFNKDGLCKSKCYWCKTEINVPIRILDGTEIESERFIITKAG